MNKDDLVILASKYYEEKFETLTSSGLFGVVHNYMHRNLESRNKIKQDNDKILELGAGNLRHLKFVKQKYNEYHNVDIRMNLMTQYCDKNKIDLTWSLDHKHAHFLKYQENGAESKIYLHETSAHNLAYFPDDYFDRIIATCLIQHVTEVERAVYEWKRVVRPGGKLDIYIHSEPRMLLRLFRMVFLHNVRDEHDTKHIRFVETEHRYSFIFCKNLLKTVFGQDNIEFTSYPIRFQSWNFSFWKIARILNSKTTESN